MTGTGSTDSDRGAREPRLVGVGVGPGDPELVTVKGVNALRAAAVVVVPVLAGAGTGRAEATVLHYVAPAKVVRVVFALNEREDRARREAAWDVAGERVAELLRAHGTVAFATIGDPNVYSTFTYLAQTVDALVPGTAVETVPGITAMQDLAARSGAVLTEGTEPLTLVPVTAGTAVLKEALKGPGTVVAYKFGRLAGEVAAALRETGRTEGAVWGSSLGLPQESIRPAAELAAEPAPGSTGLPYLSTLIAPARRESRGGKL
ncbi:precorrin-2 C(20)-methyltransferase [Streptomyces carminius]|uniref:Precorrin-2 C(20)-methyltransferase n=1 Tax=Streptomyces carminius TaxID=2665496 RepID=A0A2M8M2G0_9ACTN|nr:precorrin-2 C(20)-methyltransferase [Streptomyces carminius]PJE98380.1 precorrin-2 C(20)-methyltransferase [Streptomyces carminius]